MVIRYTRKETASREDLLPHEPEAVQEVYGAPLPARRIRRSVPPSVLGPVVHQLASALEQPRAPVGLSDLVSHQGEIRVRFNTGAMEERPDHAH